ncbi:APC family permease [Naasia sp. SYSU D00948]|uniref:APC family permease n=1 Tax=Naasia sp. SYSU D00948 TaxID=2817379 RepID=UPI0027DD6A42|nr:APC family permease [Naasia sp. SYSU D00948]
MPADPVPGPVTSAPLARRLGTVDAVVLGLASMIGAGVFTAFAPAAAAAGTGLLAGLALAAVVAFCNATSTAQLAAAHPVSGGVYTFGRLELGPWWGFLAGWGFVIGKTASIGAMGLTVAAYLAPEGWARPAAILAVLAVTAVNLLGVTRTAAAARVLVAVALAGLAIAVAAALGSADPARLSAEPGPDGGLYGILQSAALLFFAFAGYARIATLGEEVRDPSRTIPRAIVGALLLTMLIYGTVAAGLLLALGPELLARSPAPLARAAEEAGWAWAVPLIGIAAGLASLGALLALSAGIGRTVLAMARKRDLPPALAAVHPGSSVPRRAQLAVALAACLLLAVADLRTAIGFSSFGVLLYYLVANLAALRQAEGSRRYPRPLQVVGAAGCALLALTVPPASLAAGAAVLAAGLVYRAVRLRMAARR